jgi:fructose-1,6-bisphosphatase/sedoheptulose 1,7-bisphosphatase-like protein
VVGIGANATPYLETLIGLTGAPEAALRAEALRALAGETLSREQGRRLRMLATDAGMESDAPAIKRALGAEVDAKPAADDLAAWRALVDGEGDPEAGR